MRRAGPAWLTLGLLVLAGCNPGLYRGDPKAPAVATAGGFFAGAHGEVGSRVETTRDLSEGCAAHEGCASTGEIAFGEVGVAAVQLVGYHPTEECVAEVFEALVVLEAFAGVLVEV